MICLVLLVACCVYAEPDKYVAFTFDDGPHEVYTREILGILERYNAHATFFVVGKMAEKYPELIKEEFERGHEIGNHTYSHCRMTGLGKAKVSEELKKTGDIVENITGVRPVLFRPPQGRCSDNLMRMASQFGYQTILWTVYPADSGHPPMEYIYRKVTKLVKPGSIVLLHDGIPSTNEALPHILDTLQSQGYKFVTVSQLLSMKTSYATSGY
jgi:polysaccharide deacetylase family sporulation protein PdaB